MAREDVPGDRRLVAYVAPASAADQAGNLREFLKERLPAYMLPSAFVFLDAFPLTPNGKLDRKALPAPEGRSPALKGSYVAPRTPTEEAVAEIWCEVLNLKQVGIHDNFFELGGHSLLAVQLRSQIQRTLKIKFPLVAIYQWPTIEEFALGVLQQEVEALDAEEVETTFCRTGGNIGVDDLIEPRTEKILFAGLPPLPWPLCLSSARSTRADRIMAADSRESEKSNLQENCRPAIKNRQIRLLHSALSAKPRNGLGVLHGRLVRRAKNVASDCVNRGNDLRLGVVKGPKYNPFVTG